MKNEFSGETGSQCDPMSASDPAPAPAPGETTPTLPLPPYAASYASEAPTAPIPPYASEAPTAPIQPYAAPQHPYVPSPHPPYAAAPAQQPYAAPPGYGGPYVAGPPKIANGLAVSGFVVGIVSVFLPLIFGFLGGVVGLVLSIIGVVKHDHATQSAKGLGVAGIVLSSLAIILIL